MSREDRDGCGREDWQRVADGESPAVACCNGGQNRHTCVTSAAQPPTDGSDVEDALDQALRSDLCASAARGRSREKNAEEEQVKEAAEVGVGKEIREKGGGGEATEESRAKQEDLCLCLFLSVFVFIKYVIYLSTNYKDIHF